MDKIWNPQAWPKPLHENLPLSALIVSTSYTLTPYTYPPKFLQYIVAICQQQSAPVQILQLTISISSRYLASNNPYNEPMQLVLLASIFLAGKVMGNVDGSWGGLAINEIHKFSNHCFTNKDFYRIEKKILEGLGFDVLGEGVGDRQVKAVLLMIREILDMDFYHVLCKVTQDVQTVIWHYLYTKTQKQKLLKKPNPPTSPPSPSAWSNKFQHYLTASIIQTSLILCTQCVGRFPATVWLLHILELKEDQLSLMVEDVLKIVLGRDKFQEFMI